MVRQFLMFALVGAAGFAVDAGVLLLAHRVLGLDLYSGRVLSFLVAATFTWHCNRRFTFPDTSDRAGRQWLKFIGANALGGAVNLGVYMALVAHLPLARELPVLAVACGSVAGLLFNFLASRIVVFRAHLASSHRA